MIQETEEKALVSQALEARKLAYAPYSGYTVGAALLTADGHRYLGGNIENASYGATNCAERTAFFKAVSEGERAFSALAVVSSASADADYTSPCGVCRQMLFEFAPQLRVLAVRGDGAFQSAPLSTLLPCGFGPGSLNF